eukprot:5771843-Prymnesium_polylepis.1
MRVIRTAVRITTAIALRGVRYLLSRVSCRTSHVTSMYVHSPPTISRLVRAFATRARLASATSHAVSEAVDANYRAPMIGPGFDTCVSDIPIHLLN